MILADGFSIRDLKTFDEFMAVHQLQQRIWGFGEGMGLYPPILYTASRNGGTVLGAFDESGRMAGFVFGFLGRHKDGQIKLCSQAMGVLPEFRNAGIAEALKRAQRDRARAQGLKLITWTYDPLETANAHLNLRKLGGISRTYLTDLYGSQFGELNRGLPTDRLLVEWWIDDERVARALAGQIEPVDPSALPQAARTEGTGTSLRLAEVRPDLDAGRLALEVPVAFQSMKAVDPALALDWRLKVREVLSRLFSRGYVALDVASLGSGNSRRSFYIFGISGENVYK